MKLMPILAVVLSGCGAGYMSSSDAERLAFTTFEPTQSDQFKFVALTYYDSTPPEGRQSENSEQEAVRIVWLEKYLSLNSMCVGGYEIDRRTASLKVDSNYTQHQIFYYGHCVK